MTLAVSALWSCIALEARARHQAERDARTSLARLRQLRDTSVPTSAPTPWTASRRPSAS